MFSSVFSIFTAIKLALMTWSFTKLINLTQRANEIEEQIDNLGIDATKSDLMRIKRLTNEKRRIDKLLDITDTVFSEND